MREVESRPVKKMEDWCFLKLRLCVDSSTQFIPTTYIASVVMAIGACLASAGVSKSVVRTILMFLHPVFELFEVTQ